MECDLFSYPTVCQTTINAILASFPTDSTSALEVHKALHNLVTSDCDTFCRMVLIDPILAKSTDLSDALARNIARTNEGRLWPLYVDPQTYAILLRCILYGESMADQGYTWREVFAHYRPVIEQLKDIITTTEMNEGEVSNHNLTCVLSPIGRDTSTEDVMVDMSYMPSTSLGLDDSNIQYPNTGDTLYYPSFDTLMHGVDVGGDIMDDTLDDLVAKVPLPWTPSALMPCEPDESDSDATVAQHRPAPRHCNVNFNTELMFDCDYQGGQYDEDECEHVEDECVEEFTSQVEVTKKRRKRKRRSKRIGPLPKQRSRKKVVVEKKVVEDIVGRRTNDVVVDVNSEEDTKFKALIDYVLARICNNQQ